MRAPGREVVELAEVPTLGPLYARGVAGSARAAAARRRAVRADALPPVEVLVRGVRPDASHLSDYQHLLGETAGDLLPAGFVHVLAFPVATSLMVRADFPLPLLGMVHLANRVEQRRPVHLEESLDLRVHADGLRSHRKGVTVDLIAEALVDGEVVWQGVSTYLATGHRLAPQSASTSPTPVPAPSAEGTGDDDPAPVPTGRWSLPAALGRRYAAVSGDQNPIHTSPLAAKAFGFPRAIAHGMYTAARALAVVGPARPDAYLWQVDFAKPVLLPSSVAVRVAPAPDGPGHEIRVWDPRRGRTHLTGSVTPLG